MRPLTSSEKKLALAFGVILLLIVTLGFLALFWNAIQNTNRQISLLKNQINETNKLLKEADLWLQRDAWLKQTLTLAPPGGLATSALLTSLTNSARENNVTILNQSVSQIDPDPQFVITGIDLTVSATMENFVKWIHSLQRPESLTGVTKISITSDADPSKIRANLRIVRYFAPSQGQS